jgi:hypothetical protein
LDIASYKLLQFSLWNAKAGEPLARSSRGLVFFTTDVAIDINECTLASWGFTPCIGDGTKPPTSLDSQVDSIEINRLIMEFLLITE